MKNHILETKGLTKTFQGFCAVQGVDLRVARGDIHVLIGPNGAGKTTFFNLLTKFLAPTKGEIFFEDENITSEGPAQIANRGIVRSFQISAVFPNLTVLENVRISLLRYTGKVCHFWESDKTLDSLNGEAYSILEKVGIEGHSKIRAVDLPYGLKRVLEIATTLAMRPKLMLLDEPTQGMGHEDVDKITALIKEVSEGRTILMVEHNMNVVARIANRISVLSQGMMLAEGSYAEISTNPSVVEAYMGSSSNTLRKDSV